MACDFRLAEGQNPIQRKTEIEEAIDRLNAALSLGQVTMKVGPQGAVTFVGDWDRRGISDACAFRKLQVKGSPAFKMALAKAEAMAGRKVEAAVVGAGVHSHDGGKTWGKH